MVVLPPAKRKKGAMPGDPNECRKHAENCKKLAERAVIPEQRERFLGLASQWERLASELEGTKGFFDVLTKIDLPDPKV